MRTRRLLRSRALLSMMMSNHRLPKRVVLEELANAGQRGPGGVGEIMDGLLGRGSSGI